MSASTMKEALDALESWLDSDPEVVRIKFTFETNGGNTVTIDSRHASQSFVAPESEKKA